MSGKKGGPKGLLNTAAAKLNKGGKDKGPKAPAVGGNDYDKAPIRGAKLSSGGRKRKLSTKASTWQQLSARTSSETAANRDVHGSQNVDRSTIEAPRSHAMAEAVGAGVGVLVFIASWLLWGIFGKLISQISERFGGGDSQADDLRIADELGVQPYFMVHERPLAGSSYMQECFQPLDAFGAATSQECFSELSAIPRPQWHIDATRAAMEAAGMVAPGSPTAAETAAAADSWSSWLLFGHVSFWRVLVALGLALLVWQIVRIALIRLIDRENLSRDMTDINQHENDQYIMLPNEAVRKYSTFPDVGAHSSVAPSSMLSHVMLSNTGVDKRQVPLRYESDVIDENGNVEFYEGEIIYGDDGEPKYKTVPLIDNEFSHALFDASGLPREKNLRKFFNPDKVAYNPGGKNRDKTGSQATLAENINEDWILPDYEPQRPAGAYIVDEAPVNTMVLAMTRAGKGQTYIEPMIDMWLRERRPNNMVINDPKGELLVKNYVRAATRGYQVVQFNLINPQKTDIYNPLGMAAEAAREGDTVKTAMYVGNIADVFFPIDGADDPVWPSAANNAFKRTAYGMIDFYLEEERQMRKRAVAEKWEPSVLENRIDEMWGKVTLYNCYQFFVKLSAKKLKDPTVRLADEGKAGKHGDLENSQADIDAFEEKMDKAKIEAELWDGAPELDMLTLFFNATDRLPANSMRDLVGNADKSLRAMGAAEKMLASVYGIAITAMAFFTDPTISTLTSGRLSQNTDLSALSFPRRLAVRFNQDFAARNKLIGNPVRWESYSDPGFTQKLGKDFDHEDTISNEGWARYYFKGIYDTDVVYVKLRVFNKKDMPMMSFYFKFIKGYQTNLKGRAYITDEVTGKKIVKNGLLIEMVPDGNGGFTAGSPTFKQNKLNIAEFTPEELAHAEDIAERITSVPVRTNTFMQTQVRYSEQPKAVFLVTPPHLMSYAKLILILVKQLVDLNFDQSYMTKSNQKPLYKTRFMLDELGNLQSEGHGISGFETMLSIGLGQEQQFTLILQTLQQLKDVYGDSVDKIVQGNAQTLDAKIATPDGWSTMGEMAVGTEVLMPAGGTAVVDGVFPQGERKVYEVVLGDGSTTRACDEHLWEIEIEDPTGEFAAAANMTE